MAVSLSWNTSVSYTSDTQAKITVTLKATSTSGSYNASSQSGSITIAGTSYSFSHSFSANTTTTLATRSKTVSRTKASQSIKISAKFVTGVSSGTISKSGTVTVKARPTYVVTWNPNYSGGSSSTTTVYSGYTTTFPSRSRTGYTFKGWATSASASSAAYAANATTPAITKKTTYYAVWQAATYTVTYNANGGSGAPAASTKTYGTALTLSTTIPTRSGYIFRGWATSATGSVAYAAGGTYKAEGNATLYAVWANAYFEPSISGYEAVRVSDSSGNTEQQSGEYVKLSFGWTAAGTASGYVTPTKVKVELSDGTIVVAETSYTNSTGTVTAVVPVDMKTDLSAVITLTDTTNSVTKTWTYTLPQGGLPVDISQSEKNITLFGTVDDSIEGLAVYKDIYTSGSLAVKGNIDAAGSLAVKGNINAAGSLTVEGHSSPIGTVINSYLASDKSVATGTSTGTTLCSITLPSGIWLITAGFRCDSNTNGIRRASVSQNANATDMNIQVAPVSGQLCYRWMHIAGISSTTTYYLNVLQTSGSALRYSASGSGYGNFMRAVRIA